MAPTTDSTPSARWRFESLDARAGLAFASWRRERGSVISSEIKECQTLFFGPPDFSPEWVGNVALAMGAARGSFQPGLYVNGREAFFDTPEDVAEFVRRAYVGSAGGDGGDGTDEGGPPSPPDGPQDLPPIDGVKGGGNFRDEKSADSALHEDAKGFKSASDQTDFGSISAFTWTDARGHNGTDPLASAALQVMRELLLRAPVRDLKALEQWHGALRMFGGCLARMSLWPEICSGYYGTVFYGLMEAFSMPVQVFVHLDPYEKAALLFGEGPTLDDKKSIELFVYHLHRFRPFLGRAASPFALTTTADPMELLRRLPLPPYAASMAAGDLGHRASLYHALSSFTAAPRPVPSIDLVLFASACIVTCHASPMAGLIYGMRDARSSPTPLQHSALQRVAEESFAWLRQHLPRAAFSPGYEQFIASTKDIRYRGTGP